MINYKFLLNSMLVYCFLHICVLAQDKKLNDIKITKKMSVAAGTFSLETTDYIKGSRERSEMNMAGGIVTIHQCDLHKTIQLNDRTKKYLIISSDDSSSRIEESPQKVSPSSTLSAPVEKSKSPTSGGVVVYTSTSTDTGERKQMFGFTARHIKTSMTSEPSVDACNKNKLRIETDGWYIDLNYGLDCLEKVNIPTSQPSSPSFPNTSSCHDKIKFKQNGNAKLGYALILTTTIHDLSGKSTNTTTEVVDLTTTPLDSKLFEIPAGYTEAKDYMDLMGIKM